MNRHVCTASLLIASVLWQSMAMAQTTTSQAAAVHQHAGVTVHGSEHPEQVSDNRAWLMQLIASTSAARDSEQTKKHAALHGKIIGIPLQDFRNRYEKLIAAYNRARKNDRSAEQQELYDQLQSDIDLLVTDMVAYLQRNTDSEHWTKLNDRVQQSKSRISYSQQDSSGLAGITNHPLETMARLLRVSQTFGYSSSDGYTTYTAVDTDQNYWYSTVYIYGAWPSPPSCGYNSYQGLWEPPGCPNVTHNMAATNQINGVGPTNVDLGYYDPTQYVSFAVSNQQPHGANDGSENVAVAAIVNCSVGGVILSQGGLAPWVVVGWLLKYFVRYGYEWVQWNFQGTIGACNVVNSCINLRPWAVDISTVIVGNQHCAPAWIALGLCGRTGPAASWNCTYDNLAIPLSAVNWGVCTPHP